MLIFFFSEMKKTYGFLKGQFNYWFQNVSNHPFWDSFVQKLWTKYINMKIFRRFRNFFRIRIQKAINVTVPATLVGTYHSLNPLPVLTAIIKFYALPYLRVPQLQFSGSMPAMHLGRRVLREAAKRNFSGQATKRVGGIRAWPLRKKNFFKLEKRISQKMWPLSSRGGEE